MTSLTYWTSVVRTMRTSSKYGTYVLIERKEVLGTSGVPTVRSPTSQG